MTKKLSFRSTVALVIGSQIGSGVFLLPASLAMLGPLSLFGWVLSSLGAIVLALVFAKLSIHVTKGGGPHAYIERAFGRKAAFFAAWVYWVISWVSSIAVIVASIGYLSPLIGVTDPFTILMMEIGLVGLITLINMQGVTLAGSIEVILTFLKCTPLLVIPLTALFFLKGEHFYPLNPEGLGIFSSMHTATVMTFWGFIGLEAATTTASMIENPTKTIPRAVIVGTLVVAFLYAINSIGIMGIVPRETLLTTQAPYVDATRILFGHGWDLAISLIAFIACVGTLNAWVLTSGQIAKEAAQDGLLPPIFGKAPLLIAFLCTALILIFTATPNLLAQLNAVIDLSVTVFVLIYLACALAALKIVTGYRFVIFAAILFSAMILFSASWANLLVLAALIALGIPFYAWTKLAPSR
jgi:APA family basic amino acid/polyamine antiporter